MIDWEKRFPMFSLTRQHLKDVGLKEEYLKLLNDEDIQRISTHAGELLLSNGSFTNAINFAAWNLILGTKLDGIAHEHQCIENELDQRERPTDKQ
jgi:hypothetical protein